jgi:hypothetical protein
MTDTRRTPQPLTMLIACRAALPEHPLIYIAKT